MENRNVVESNAHNAPPSTVGSQPWWCGVGYGAARAVPPNSLVEDTSKQPRIETNGYEGKQSPEDNIDEGGAESKGTWDMAAEAGSNGSSEQEQQMQPVNCQVPPMMAEYFVPHTQLELGPSIACAPYPYTDPYYGGMMAAAFGTQSLAHPQFIGMPQTRMALPLEMAEEPVYVNAKQYHGILRRRQSRAKAELEKKLVKVRKPYLHESRHQHAMRRARGCGGRFLNTKKGDGDASNSSVEKDRSSGLGNSLQSDSSGSKNMHSGALGNPDPRNNSQENSKVHGVCESCTYASQNGGFQQHTGFQFDRGEDGDCSGQQRNDILAKGCRTVTIQ